MEDRSWRLHSRPSESPLHTYLQLCLVWKEKGGRQGASASIQQFLEAKDLAISHPEMCTAQGIRLTRPGAKPLDLDLSACWPAGSETMLAHQSLHHSKEQGMQHTCTQSARVGSDGLGHPCIYRILMYCSVFRKRCRGLAYKTCGDRILSYLRAYIFRHNHKT